MSLLQFADDTLLFCKPTVEQLVSVKRLMKCFQLMSGLKINYRKCSFFGFGADIQAVESWVEQHLCNVGRLPTTYLGLPLGAKSNCKEIWAPVVEKLQLRIGSWKTNYLSMGGRVTMIKAVISALPMYFLSLYKIPIGVKNRLESTMRRFLWGGTEMKKKLHLVDWKVVSSPKEVGGLGISNLEVQNGALLTKWVYTYGNETENLWRQVIVSKINSNPSSLYPEVDTRRRTSFIWRNITNALLPCSKFFGICSDNFTTLVGNGNRILFWQDSWIDGITLQDAFRRIYALAANKTGVVSYFGHWENSNWRWDIQLRRPVFDWESQQWDDFIPTVGRRYLNEENRDILAWKGNSDGRYSVSSFYKRSHYSNNMNNSLWKIVWSGLAPPKVETFCWQIMRDRVATKAELLRRGMIEEATAKCALCKSEVESVNHLFFHCPLSWSIWASLVKEKNLAWCCSSDAHSFLLSWVNLVGTKHKETWIMLFQTVIWSIWLFRNQMVFNGSCWDSIQLLNSIKCRYAFWINAKWPSCCLSVDDIMRGYDHVNMGRNKEFVRVDTNWVLPCSGRVKFNVYGASKGKPCAAGIRGLLRDSNGVVLAIFSKSVGVEDSNAAEFLAIREAALIFSMSRWTTQSLTIESDSKNAVEWANKPDKAP